MSVSIKVFLDLLKQAMCKICSIRVLEEFHHMLFSFTWTNALRLKLIKRNSKALASFFNMTQNQCFHE